MKWVWWVFVALILVVILNFHVNLSLTGSGYVERNVKKRLVCIDTVWHREDGCIYNSFNTALIFEFYGDNTYSVHFGETNIPPYSSSSTCVMTGKMDNARQQALFALKKETGLKELGHLAGWREKWLDMIGVETSILVGTNSILVVSDYACETLRFAVTNAIPNGCRMDVNALNPIVPVLLGDSRIIDGIKIRSWE